MSLGTGPLSGNLTSNSEVHPIARDGPQLIYYDEEPVDIVSEYGPDGAVPIVGDMLDEAVEELRMNQLDTRKLINIENDVLSRDPPTDRHSKRAYAAVRDKLGHMEYKCLWCNTPEGFQVTPRMIPNQRDAYYIFGMSGCGKSTWCSRYALEWLREHPGQTVYLFSRKTQDPVFDGVIPTLVRIALDRKFITDHQTKGRSIADPISKYANSLVIFDDFHKIEDPMLLKAVLHLKNSMYELGRQYDIDICSIQHKGMGGAKSQVELCESTAIVCFPKMNLGESQKVLTTYLRFTKDQMSRIFDEKGKQQRWMCIIRPNIIVTQDYIKIVD